MKRKCRTAIMVFLSITLLEACGFRYRYSKDNIICYGSQKNLFSRTEYFKVFIGTPTNPFTGSPVLTLKFLDGTIVRTDQLDVSWLKAKSINKPRYFYIERYPDNKKEWPLGLEEIYIGGYGFLVNDQKVLMIEVTWWGSEIGNADGTIFYPLPLKQKQVIQLFGKPDSIEKHIYLGDPL